MLETDPHNQATKTTHPFAKNRVFGRGPAQTPWAILTRLSQGKLDFVLGRFYRCRKLYGVFRTVRQLVATHSTALQPIQCATSVFEALQIDDAVRMLKIKGLYTDLQLPDDVTKSILKFAQNNLCKRWQLDDLPEDYFLVDQIEHGFLPDGRPVSCADVVSPSSCPAIERIVHDPFILSLFRTLKGYPPRSSRIRLFWYIGLEASHPANSLLPSQAGLFHYDVPGFDSMAVFFYITDADRNSGAHVVIEGSHKTKTLPMLFGKRYRSDEYVHRHYGEHCERIIEHRSGYGFVEDPYCIHKFCTPLRSNRLALQIQYF